jgi:predicted nucleic acid-binding protein
MIVVDTIILIELYKGNREVIQTLQHIGSGNIAVSAITKAELFYGARDKQELLIIEKQLVACHCLELNETISDQARATQKP